MKQPVLLLLLGCMHLCTAQIFQPFDNPLPYVGWQGPDSVFTVNASGQLQLNAVAAGEAYLSVPCTTAVGEWNFWCRFQYSPSTSNFMRVYLMSDTSVLGHTQQGYYVQLGGVSGNNDSILLYRQDGTTRTLLLGGRRATVSKSDNTVRIKVLRDEQGYWQLFSDTTGTQQFVLEGTATDATYMVSKYMGVYARYTAGNGKRMFWDDVYAGDIRVDEEGPKVSSVTVQQPTQLKVFFDEPLDAETALNPNNYELNNGLGLSAAANWGGNQQTVLLDFGEPLNNGSYKLTLRNLSDLLGNTIPAQQVELMYYVPQPDDIIISEWLPDPTPTLGIPEREFMELYNRTTQDIAMAGWMLTDGTTMAVFPADTLRAHSFAIVCAAADTDLFTPFGKTIPLSAWPSLNNSSDRLEILFRDATVVHTCAYDLSWYGDVGKSAGGYSIELNAPYQLCKSKVNAGASNDEWGGTPGKANSRWTLASDTTSPTVLWCSIHQSNLIRVLFNEPMDTLKFPVVQLHQQTVSAQSWWQKDTLTLQLKTPLHKDSVYALHLLNTTDCSGNILRETLAIQYLVADTPQLFDVLIHEVMSDPDPVLGLPNAEYVELYNRSKQLISLAGWQLSDGTDTAVLKSTLLYPDSFVVLTSATKLALFADVNNIIGLSNFPSLGNESDTLWLRTPEGKTVHWMNYQSSQHSSMLKRNGGWSLELVDVFNPCGLVGNWKSSVHPSGGTPGKPNSVTAKNRDKQAPRLLRVCPVSDVELKLQFSESLDTCWANNRRFKIAPLTVQSISFAADGYTSLTLTLTDRLQKRVLYSVEVDSLRDCAGNQLPMERYEVGLPEGADSGDVVVNELLFNPTTGGSDFVELYNRSEHIIDVSKLYLSNRNAEGDLDNLTPVCSEALLLFPNQYLVCSPDIQWVQQTYGVANSKGLLQTTLPSYNDDAGHCVLTNQQQVLDELVYDEQMHLSVLDNKEGVSLERIDYNRPTADRSNWTSASATSGYATPVARNSQYAATIPSVFIKAEPQVFSPDGDGYNDLINLSYTCEWSGSIGSFWVYNAAGNPVKRLLNNALLGSEGVFSWDGMMDNGQPAPMGLYVGYFEVFTTQGTVQSEKLTIVVAAKL